MGVDNYTLMHLMQVVGERNVRIVPDVAVNGTGSSAGLVEALLGTMLKRPALAKSVRAEKGLRFE